jgi:glucose/mannose transport system permease protein
MTQFRHRLSAAGWALFPSWLVALVLFAGTALWTVQLSFTSSRILPVSDFVGFQQYIRLFSNSRWLTSLQNMVVYGVLFLAGGLILGLAMAIALDRRVRFENTFRTLFLYPQAISFVVTGLVWQWMMNPQLGVDAVLRGMGIDWLTVAWATNPDLALYAVVLAAVWQSAGLVMVFVLSNLRGIDDEQWRAARVDGVPIWRIYASIIVPQLGPGLSTAGILIALGIIKTYDVVVALTQGGPGLSTEVPAKFVMDSLFARQNLGLATAASVVLMIVTLAVAIPFVYVRSFSRKAQAR